MRVFVAFGFNDRDKWVKDLVFPVVKEVTGHEPMHGEHLEGEELAPEIVDRIGQSDGFIGFLTRRAGTQNGELWGTHEYVVSELGAAVGKNVKRVIEVREEGVVEQKNLVSQSRQIIRYKEEERDRCIAAIAISVARWVREQPPPVRLVLSPKELAEEMRGFLRKKSVVTCTYQVVLPEEQAPGVRLMANALAMGEAGLECRIPRPPNGAKIEVTVEGPYSTWTSILTPVDEVKITLLRDTNG